MQGRNTLGYLRTRTFYTPERKYAYIYRLPVVQGPTDSSLKLVIGRVSWESDRKIASNANDQFNVY